MFGEALTVAEYQRYLRVQLAKTFGWTLDYIDSLGTQDWLDTVAVLQALNDLDTFAGA